MRKFLLKNLIICLVLCSSLAIFTACNGGGDGETPPAHTHVYNKQIVSEEYKESEATCENRARYVYSCECGARGSESFEAGSLENHVYINGHCKWCNEEEPIEPEPPTHIHQFNRQYINDDYKKKDADCVNPAEYYFSCECGEKGNEYFEFGSELGHDFGDFVSNGDGTHSQICANDNSHKITGDCLGGNATEDSRAICEICNSEYGATLNHTHSFIQQKTTDKFIFKKATCESVAEYFYSCACGEKGSDTFEYGTELGHDYGDFTSNGNGTHTKVCKNDNSHVITGDCSGGTPTCQNQAVCVECDGGYGELADHEFNEIKGNATQHWLECKCGEKDGITGHSGGEATCENKAVCSTCDTPYGALASCVYVNGYCKWCNDSLPAFTRDGDTIYFGSYPQTKVTDSDTITDLLSLAGNPLTDTNGWTSYNYYVDGVVSDIMYYNDVKYQDEKYRGVYIKNYRPEKPGYSFHTNVQEMNGYFKASVYWFKYEPINWEVVEEEGLNVKLVSRMIIDSQEFDYKNGSYSNNYAESTIRAWLNDEFYNMAFNDLEKSLIQTTFVDNRAYTIREYDNPNVCENTNDKVFLISNEEIWDFFPLFGESRRKVTTDYARSVGAYTYFTDDDYYNGRGNYWQRSPHKTEGYGWCGVFGGPIDQCDVRVTHTGVAPVIVILAGDPTVEHVYDKEQFDSYKHWKECECGNRKDIEPHYGGTPTCQSGAECELCGTRYGLKLDHEYTEIKYNETEHWNECLCGEKQPVEAHKGGEATCKNRANCSVCNEPYGTLVACVYVGGKCKWCNEDQPATYVREGNYIYFGEYPQTIKNESVTITEIQDYRGYYLGSDNEFYAKLVCLPYHRYYELSDGTAVDYDDTLYFKVEPVKWRILSENEGTALLLCEYVIDNRKHDTHVSDYNFNYANSEIRTWLNNDFYNNIFDDLQKQLVLTTNVDNSVSSTDGSNHYSCVNTNDKVFLLSHKELTTGSYGFNAGNEINSYRQKTASDYALANGVDVSISNDEGYEFKGKVKWLTRSPYGTLSSRYDTVLCVSYDGKLNDAYSNAYMRSGIAPAITINLQ